MKIEQILHKDESGHFICFVTDDFPLDIPMKDDTAFSIGDNYEFSGEQTNYFAHPLEIAIVFKCVEYFLITDEILIGNYILKNGEFSNVDTNR